MNSREKLLRIVQDRQLVSYSNDTRWRNFVAKIVNLPIQARVKWIFDPEPTSWGGLSIPTQGYLEPYGFGPIPFREIEWLELDATEHKSRGRLIADLDLDHSDDIEAALIECKLSFSTDNKKYRVFGYR